MPHPGDAEQDAAGRTLAVDGRPYMVPTPGWIEYLKEHIRRAIDAGAEGIWPEEPLLHAAGGYSPAFREAWQSFFRTPWQPPHASPEAFFMGSRLKADLYLRAIDELLRYTHEYGRSKGRDVRFLLPVHSAPSYAAWNLIFPHAAATRLPIDGVVAQVWTGPSRTPVAYEGRSEVQVFQNSWIHYSYFASLMEGLKEKPLYFLADPVEDDPSTPWDQCERWYRQVVAASLYFPQARGYEVMPWPERVYLPTSRPPGGKPAAYLALLSNVMSALQEIPGAPESEWRGGTRGVGALFFDTAMWQRGGPRGSSMRSLQGLVLPLLNRGIPIELVPGERVAEREWMSRFRVLLVSYDMQKPLSPVVNDALADWVRAGGALVVFGSEDAYNDLPEWWKRSGFSGPTDHLLRACGVDTARRAVRSGDASFRVLLRSESRAQALENRRIYTVPITGAAADGKPLYLRFRDAFPEDGWGAWVGRVRVLEGGKARADFGAGSPAERPFLVEDLGSQRGDGHRFADGDASFVYRFRGLSRDAVVELELGNQFEVSAAEGEDPGALLQPVVSGRPAVRAASRYPIVFYPEAGVQPVYRLAGGDAIPVWSVKVGSGTLVYCGLPAAIGADSAAGGELVRSLAKLACEAEGLAYVEAPLVMRRGPYVVAHSLGRTVRLSGEYLDLFRAEMPLVRDPELPYREPALLKRVDLQTRIPILLHGSHRARVLESTAARLRVQVEGPAETEAVLRVFPAGMSLAGIDAFDGSGQRVAAEERVEGRTILVRCRRSPGGTQLTLRWIRPEARLTK